MMRLAKLAQGLSARPQEDRGQSAGPLDHPARSTHAGPGQIGGLDGGPCRRAGPDRLGCGSDAYGQLAGQMSRQGEAVFNLALGEVEESGRGRRRAHLTDRPDGEPLSCGVPVTGFELPEAAMDLEADDVRFEQVAPGGRLPLAQGEQGGEDGAARM